jgi:hypothetical protein
MKRGILVLLAAAFVFNGCSNREDGVRLNEELVPYYEAFRIEAEARGIVFDNSVEQIEGYIQNISYNGVAGACTRSSDPNRNRFIVVDKPYWNSATDMEKEFVVFHELGHCFLDRDHLNTTDGSGNCISIMASGTTGCNTNYLPSTRDEMIDELFGL